MSALRYVWSVDAKSGARVPRFYFEACTREPASWKEEMYAAARIVTNRAQKPLWVCFDGSFEGEILCRAFFEQGIAFAVLTLEYEDGSNKSDVQLATLWCRERGIPQEIIKINIYKFYTEEINAYTDKYPALLPYRYLQIRLMELVESRGGYAVIAGGEQVFLADTDKKTLTKDDLYIVLAIGNTSPIEWCKDNALEHEPFFHYVTPELYLSYMRAPLVQFALEHPNEIFRHSGNSYMLKRFLYQNSWPDLQRRYQSEGFEQSRLMMQKVRRRLSEKFQSNYALHKMPVRELEGYLTGKISGPR